MRVLGQRADSTSVVIDASISSYVDKEKFVKRYQYYYFPVTVNGNNGVSIKLSNFGDVDVAIEGLAKIEQELVAVSFRDWTATYLGFSLKEALDKVFDELANDYDKRVVIELQGYITCALHDDKSSVVNKELDNFMAAYKLLKLINPAFGKSVWGAVKNKDYDLVELALLFSNHTHLVERSLLCE